MLKSYAERLLKVETELSDSQQKGVEAEAWQAAHWQAGYEQGVQQQKNDAKAKVRRAQTQSSRLVLLSPSVNALVGHGVQSPWLLAPRRSLYVLLTQGMTTPALHQVPGSQRLHSSALRRPSWLL